MTTTTTINSFQGTYRFLSNFYIEPDGTCVEVEYQAAKCANEAEETRFIGLTPGHAKRLGRQVKLRPDWEDVKLSIMEDLVWKKFGEHAGLAALLRETGDAELIEGNNWGDRYWGVYWGSGANHLGRILMRVRDDLNERFICR